MDLFIDWKCYGVVKFTNHFGFEFFFLNENRHAVLIIMCYLKLRNFLHQHYENLTDKCTKVYPLNTYIYALFAYASICAQEYKTISYLTAENILHVCNATLYVDFIIFSQNLNKCNLTTISLVWMWRSIFFKCPAYVAHCWMGCWHKNHNLFRELTVSLQLSILLSFSAYFLMPSSFCIAHFLV